MYKHRSSPWRIGHDGIIQSQAKLIKCLFKSISHFKKLVRDWQLLSIQIDYVITRILNLFLNVPFRVMNKIFSLPIQKVKENIIYCSLDAMFKYCHCSILGMRVSSEFGELEYPIVRLRSIICVLSIVWLLIICAKVYILYFFNRMWHMRSLIFFTYPI